MSLPGPGVLNHTPEASLPVEVPSVRTFLSPLLALLALLLASCTTSSGIPVPHDASTGVDEMAASSSLWVMSFNLRYNNPGDGADAWPRRTDEVASMIRLHRADLVGVQEARRGMLADLAERLPAFDWFGLPRADGSASDEYSAIFYRPDRLERLDHGTFWLSETPDVRASTGWDAALPRIVTWGRFRDRATGDTLFHFNTHFDHRGDTARAESARLLRTRSAKIAGPSPTVVTGDFNARPDARPYALLTGTSASSSSVDAPPFRDALRASVHGHHGPRSTWSGFDAIVPGRRIDYIFVRGAEVRVLQHAILTDTFTNGRFPSDHLPVLAEIRIE